jgi:hypothetical protein
MNPTWTSESADQNRIGAYLEYLHLCTDDLGCGPFLGKKLPTLLQKSGRKHWTEGKELK